MASRDAGFAAGTLIEIDLKRVLLARARGVERQKIPIVAALQRGISGFVLLGKAGHRGQEPLLFQQLVDECFRFYFR